MIRFPHRFPRARVEVVQGCHRLAIIILSALVLMLLIGGVSAQFGASPETPPDAQTGRIVFLSDCTSCHGQFGLGDGEAIDQLGGNMPTALADPEYLREAVPAEMFEVITEGRIEKLMPPFGVGTANVDPLPEEERWDVIAYIFSLGVPVESIELGQTIYEQNCLDCHGERGEGDGPLADEAGGELGDLSDLSYWSQNNNQTVFDSLVNGPPISAHEASGLDLLLEDEIWSTVDYIRTFGYQFIDAHAESRPLDEARVSGSIMNGTTGESFTQAGAVVELRAYNQDLEETLVLTTTAGADGSYQFDLTEARQDQFYRVSVNYNGVEFGSDFGSLTSLNPDLDLPVVVFETTADPSVLSIDRLHQILSFFEGGVSVSELYVVNNNSESVYVGESGNTDEGTFEVILPADAQDIAFQRAFGSIDSFIPANELVSTGRGWADTFPLRPGPSSLILLASYIIPYDDGVTISHPVLYTTSQVNVALPETGVSLSDEDEWQDLGQRTMGPATVSNFGKSNLPAGSVVTINLEGEPDLSASSPGTITLDNQSELLIGLAIALVVLGLAGVFIWRWRKEPVAAAAWESGSREELLQAIADLDDDYEAGQIGERRYRSERELLKAELVAIWEEEQGSKV